MLVDWFLAAAGFLWLWCISFSPLRLLLWSVGCRSCSSRRGAQPLQSRCPDWVARNTLHLPRPGIEPVSSALADIFLVTGPPGKFRGYFIFGFKMFCVNRIKVSVSVIFWDARLKREEILQLWYSNNQQTEGEIEGACNECVQRMQNRTVRVFALGRVEEPHRGPGKTLILKFSCLVGGMRLHFCMVVRS